VKGYGLAIMTNADQGGPVMAELNRRIQQAYEWDSFAEEAPRGYAPPVARTEITLSENVLRRYVGEYQLSDETIVVTFEDGQLHAQPAGQTKFPIFPESEVKFFLRAVNAQVTFTRNHAGETTGLILHQGGRDQTARKIR
jgi:hypothetical protein